MAHIPDGVLSLPVLVAGGTVAAGALAISLRKLQANDVPRASVLAAVFFVCSLIVIPVGPTTVHPILNGLMGLVLGWVAVPAIAVALFLQMVFFGFGGVTAYGVNLMNIALPALLCGLLLRPWLRRAERSGTAGLTGALAGTGGVLLTAILVALALVLSDPAYVTASRLVLVTYFPLLVVEAAVTAAAVSFLWRVSPEMVGAVR